jgi:hypothetical protein
MSTAAYRSRSTLENDYAPFEKVGDLLENDPGFLELAQDLMQEPFDISKFSNFTVKELLGVLSRKT